MRDEQYGHPPALRVSVRAVQRQAPGASHLGRRFARHPLEILGRHGAVAVAQPLRAPRAHRWPRLNRGAAERGDRIARTHHERHGSPQFSDRTGPEIASLYSTQALLALLRAETNVHM